jgi:hypothetical protein
MKPASSRSGRYEGKVRGHVIPGQGAHFRDSVEAQVDVERFVKSLQKPAILQNYYMIFAKQVIKARSAHSGGPMASECLIALERWVSRGLDPGNLYRILRYLEVRCLPFRCDVSPLDGCDYLT